MMAPSDGSTAEVCLTKRWRWKVNFGRHFGKIGKLAVNIVQAYGADLAEVTIPETFVRDGAKLTLDSSRDEIRLRSGQVLQGVHVVIATPQGAADPAVVGRKPGHELQKDRICRAALAVLDNDANRPPKRRGRRAQLGKTVLGQFPDYELNSIEKMIRVTVADWERGIRTCDPDAIREISALFSRDFWSTPVSMDAAMHQGGAHAFGLQRFWSELHR